MSTRFQALGKSVAATPLQHMMSGFRDSWTSIGCVGSIYLSSEAVILCLSPCPSFSELTVVLFLNIYTANTGYMHFFVKQVVFCLFVGWFFWLLFFLGFFLLFFWFFFCIRGLWKKTCKICESAGAHREQVHIKQNVHIHVPILDVNELAEWTHRGETQTWLPCFPPLPPLWMPHAFIHQHPLFHGGFATHPCPLRRWLHFFGVSAKKVPPVLENGIFHYLSRLCWMSHRRRLVLAGLVSTRGIAWQRLRGLASFTEMWGC